MKWRCLSGLYFKLWTCKWLIFYELSNCQIWIYILLAYILVSLTIWIVARLISNGPSAASPSPSGSHLMSGQTLTLASTRDLLFKTISLSQTGFLIIILISFVDFILSWQLLMWLFSNKSWKTQLLIWHLICSSFWFAVGTLMQQGSDLNPKVQNYHQRGELPLYKLSCISA